MDYKNVQLELTNACNLTCVECPHYMMKRPVKEMSDEVFDAALDLFIREKPVDAVILDKDGEPLLAKNLISRLLKLSSVFKGTINIYTNGIFLDENFFQFISSLPNKFRILVSFHFYNYDGFKNDYSYVDELLRKVALWTMPNVELILVSHKTKYISDEELLAWQKSWVNTPIGSRFGGIHINTCIETWQGKVDGNFAPDKCSFQDKVHLFIGNTGNVCACCADLEEEISFGNILFISPEIILDRRNKFYDDLVHGIYNHKLCKKCMRKE